jgi:hypothetical protein
MRTESEFLVDALTRLNDAAIDYMLTGSMASNYWGIPRTTHDLDFVIVMQPSQAKDLISAFQPGFFVQPESVMTVFRPPYQFNVLDEQSAMKADFWLLRENEFEKAAFARRMHVNLFGVGAWITTAEDSILHKLYWNSVTPSDRQLSDAAGVFEVQRESLDVPYLKRWAAALRVESTWEALKSGSLKPKAT